MPRGVKNAKKTEVVTPSTVPIVEVVEEAPAEEVEEVVEEVEEDLDEEEEEAKRVLAEIQAKKDAKRKTQVEEKINTIKKRVESDSRYISHFEEVGRINEAIESLQEDIRALDKERDQLSSEHFKTFEKEFAEISDLKNSIAEKPTIKKIVTVEGKRTRKTGVTTREHEALQGIKELKFRQHVITCETDFAKIIYRHGNLFSNSINGIVSQILLGEGVKSQVNCWEKTNVVYYDTKQNLWRGIGVLRDAWRVKNNIGVE